MGSQLTMYITLVATSGVLTSFLFIYALLKRKELPGYQSLIVLTLLESIYIFAFAFELTSKSLAEIKFWTSVEYAGIAFAPVFGLLLCMRYIGMRLSRKAIFALFVIPSITFVLVATNDLHQFFYKSFYMRADSPTVSADVEAGYWYVVHGSFTFACLLAGAVLLLRQWNKTKKAYKLPLFTLICGQFIPMVSAFVYLLGMTPNGIDPVPFVFCITSAMYIWAIMSSRMLTIVPIAKEALFDSMHEGVVVLDMSRRLIDYNPSIRSMLPGLKSTPLGKRLDEAWLGLTSSPFPDIDTYDVVQQEIRVGIRLETFVYQARFSKVMDKYGEHIGYLLILIDVTEASRLQEQLKQMAYYDGLTGILNRTQFIARGKGMLDLAVRENRLAAVILFDIDHFKSFNDTYGHEVGDSVLTHAVNTCKVLLPEESLFARYGGEEFVVAAHADNADEALELAERLRLAIAGKSYEAGNHSLSITASFGVATFGDGGRTLEELLRSADAALYRSKHGGRNRVTLHGRQPLDFSPT